jgi:hypothetical protein
MTSPRQRKKRLRALLAKQKKEVQVVAVETKPQPVVATPAAPVVESPNSMKAKKTKNALVETKPQDQVVEQTATEVNTSSKE